MYLLPEERRVAPAAPRCGGTGESHPRATWKPKPRDWRTAVTDPQLGVLMLVLFIFLIMLGFPIAFTLMAMGVGFAFLAYDGNMDTVAALLVQRTWSVMTNDVLISVPLFVFMGYIVERANILDRLFRSVQLASGALPGSLAIATLVTCALFATATGIV